MHFDWWYTRTDEMTDDHSDKPTDRRRTAQTPLHRTVDGLRWKSKKDNQEDVDDFKTTTQYHDHCCHLSLTYRAHEAGRTLLRRVRGPPRRQMPRRAAVPGETASVGGSRCSRRGSRRAGGRCAPATSSSPAPHKWHL